MLTCQTLNLTYQEGPVAISRDSQRLLSEIAYERLKRDIMRCQLEPGREFTESRVTARYRLSKAPVRAALLRLYQEGLVQPRARRGYLIRPVTVQDVRDLFQLRLLLEPAAARLAAGRADPEQLRRLNAACLGGYDPGDRSRAAAFLDANKRFHVSIAQAAGNVLLSASVARIFEEMDRLFHLGFSARSRSREVGHEHEALIRALRAGDGERAERVAREHIEGSRRMIMEAILASPRVSETRLQTAGGEGRPGQASPRRRS